MCVLSGCFETIVGIFTIISGVAGLIAFIVAIKTLKVTNTSLTWARNDRENQDKKEFEQLIFENIKAISIYCFDIAKVIDIKKFHNVNEIKDAEEQVFIGLTYLRSYSITHNLPLLEVFATGNYGDSMTNKNSFAYNFFNVSHKYISYREKMFNAGKSIGRQKAKLQKYYSLFSEYLQIGTTYANTVLKSNTHKEDTFYKDYVEDINSLVDFATKEKLL